MFRRFFLVTALLIAVVMQTPSVMATPEYAKKETKTCTFCHTAIGKPDLNDAGKYYKDHNLSLEGYVEKKKFSTSR